MLTRHEIQLRGFQAPRDFLELAHPGDVLVTILRIMRKVSGKQHQLRRLRGRIEQLHRMLKGLAAERIGRSVETHMRVAELREAKRRRRLAIPLAQRVGDGLPECEPRRELIQRRRSHRDPGNPEKRAPVENLFHRLITPLASATACGVYRVYSSEARFIPESANFVTWSVFSAFGALGPRALRVVRNARLVTVVQEVMRLHERHGFHHAWLQRV